MLRYFNRLQTLLYHRFCITVQKYLPMCLRGWQSLFLDRMFVSNRAKLQTIGRAYLLDGACNVKFNNNQLRSSRVNAK